MSPMPDSPAVSESSQPRPTSLALDVKALTRLFGRGTRAVDDVSLVVTSGEVFGLVGPDGAGKSTLIRMLATVLAPTGGDALVFGESVVSRPSAVKLRVGYMSQRFSLYPDLTVAENVRFFADLRGVPRADVRQRTQRLLEFAGLTEFASRRAEHLSGGMKQKLALAVTLMHEPDLLLLDEPTTGVDPVSRREFWRIIAGLHRQGITVFIATPYMDEAERCTTVAFMDAGRIILHDTPAGLKARVPGRLIEIESSDERRALEAVRNLPNVLGATVHGDVVRILASKQAPGPEYFADTVSAAQIDVRRAEYGRIDMEIAFAHLAEDVRLSRTPDGGTTP